MRDLVPVLALPACLLLAGFAAAQEFARERAILGFINEATSMDLADVDGDGDDDVFISTVLGAVAWYENTSASRFDEVHVIQRGQGTYTCQALADINADGHTDFLVSSRQSQRIVARLGIGNGEFGVQRVIPSDSLPALDLALGDVDGDGRVDLVYLQEVSPGSFVVRFRAGIGDGSFGAASLVTSGALTQCETADLDGDGTDEILVGGGSLDAWSRQGTGAFTMQPVSSQAPIRFGTHDLDGDGDLDAYYSMAPVPGAPMGRVEVAENLGSGGWSTPTIATDSLAHPSRVVAGDLDGDGIVDLAVLSGSDLVVHLLSGAGSGFSFALPQLSLSSAEELIELQVGDIGVDGDADIAALGGNYFSGIFVQENVGAFPLKPPVNLNGDTDGVWEGFTADFDGDGDDDILWESDGRSVFIQESLGDFRFATPVEVRDLFPAQALWLSPCDLNHDGATDVLVERRLVNNAVSVGWLENLGSLQFAPLANIILTQGSRLYPHLDDLDGDGLEDLITLKAGQVEWRRHLGGGVFGGTQPPFVGAAPLSSYASGDLDGDGDIDVAFSTGQTIGWWENLGAAGFAPAVSIPVSSAMTGQVEAGDYDGDGDHDLYLGSEAAVLFSRGDGTFDPPLALHLPGGPFSSGPPKFIDVNRDGALDWTTSRGPDFAVALSDGAGDFGAPSLTPYVDEHFDARRTFGGDVDGDGDVDLVTTGLFIRVFENYAILGEDVCGSAQPTSTGMSAELRLTGSPLLSRNDLVLRANSLPPSTFGIFIGSRTIDFVPNPGGSQGSLCLGGQIGRYSRPGEIQFSGPSGTFALAIDLMAIPGPTGTRHAAVGETWAFQAWFRDANPQATSNFTSARSLRIDY